MTEIGQPHSLLRALSEREPEIAAHCRRVMLYSLSLASALQLNEEDIRVLGTGAMLHDVGKLAIPSAILHKPAERLTAEEQELVNEHTHLGEGMVLAAGLGTEVADLIRYHHERWDGTGYPERLTGSDIPLLARILTLVDAYDHMTASRPYQLPRLPLDALIELQLHRGSRFDPHLVDLFVKMPPLAVEARHLRNPALSGIAYAH